MRTTSTRAAFALILSAASAAALAGPASAQSPSAVPVASAGPAESPVPAASGVPAVAGPVFPGNVAQAIPPLVNGAAVKVQGPVTADAQAKDAGLSPTLLAILKAVHATQVDFAMGSNDQLMILGIRVPDVDSVALDTALETTLAGDSTTSGLRVDVVAGRAVHAFETLGGTQYAWVNGDKLYWVFGPDGAAQQAVAAMPGSSVPLVPGGAPAPATTVDLTIDSGPDAGTYHAELASGGCSANALGHDQYGLQYSVTEPGTVFRSLQVIVDHGKAATKKKGSPDLYLDATINDTHYRVDAANGEGRGTAHVTLPKSGPIKATYDLKATTTDKVTVEATVSCASLIDMGN
ncbi:MAG: hypothetical protein U0869_17570 [Chloroflexota bacterium]